jgi:hypothetical protein
MRPKPQATARAQGLPGGPSFAFLDVVLMYALRVR